MGIDCRWLMSTRSSQLLLLGGWRRLCAGIRGSGGLDDGGAFVCGADLGWGRHRLGDSFRHDGPGQR